MLPIRSSAAACFLPTSASWVESVVIVTRACSSCLFSAAVSASSAVRRSVTERCVSDTSASGAPRLWGETSQAPRRASMRTKARMGAPA